MFDPKGLFDVSLVALHRGFDSYAVLLAVAEETDSVDIFDGRFASIYGFESFTPLVVVALYLDMVHLGLGEISVSILENAVSDIDLIVAEKVISSRVSVRVEEVLIFFDGLFGMPATSSISKDGDLYSKWTYRKSSWSPSEIMR